MKKIKEAFIIISYFLAAFSPLYLKYILGQTYYVGMFIGAISVWGFYCINTRIAKEDNLDTKVQPS
jgi:hypothetical protein